MNIQTVTYSNGKEIDVSQSLTATVRSLASGTVFSAEEIAHALHAAHPQDEGCNDLDFLTSQARRWISRSLANPMNPSLSMHLCDAQGSDFVRR